MTVEELRTEVWDRLGEDPDDPQRYSSADVLEWLNDGVQHIVSRAGLRFGRTTITQRAGQLFYDLPEDCIHVSRVKYFDDGVTAVGLGAGQQLDNDFNPDAQESDDTTLYILDPIHYRELDDAVRQWPRRVGSYATCYAVFGLNELMLYPRIASGTLLYSVEYLKDIGDSDMSADTDEPTLPDQYHESLIDYAVLRAMLIDRQSQGAIDAFKDFSGQVGQSQSRKASIPREYVVTGSTFR